MHEYLYEYQAFVGNPKVRASCIIWYSSATKESYVRTPVDKNSTTIAVGKYPTADNHMILLVVVALCTKSYRV